MFVIILIFASIMKRLSSVRSTKSNLKKKLMKISELNFQDGMDIPQQCKYGDLTFTIDYIYARGSLVIGVVHASGLHSNTNSEIDCYVRVRIEPDLWKLKPRKTNIVHKTNSPSFTKKFHFRIPLFELNRVTVVFEIFDHDGERSCDHMLGVVRFGVSSLTQAEMEEFPILRKTDISPPIDNDDGYGEICIILRYIPVDHTLNVTILEAKKLHLKGDNSFPSVFVSVSMFNKKEMMKEKHTSLKSNTRDPFYSETFKFRLRPAKILSTNLIVKVFKKLPLGINKCIGNLDIGCESKLLSGRDHWTSIMTNPRIAVANWHVLSKKI